MPVNSLKFDELRYANVQRDKEWNPRNTIPASFRALECAGEIGEICNIVKKIERERLELQGSRSSLMDLVNELGDAQIALDLLAMHYSLDLGLATRLKFNATSEKLGWKTLL